VRRRGQSPVTGTGESINISSTGLLFRCDRKLQPGDSIIMALDWPPAASEHEPLYLVVSGYVVRVKGLAAAVSISRNELVRGTQLRRSFELFSKRLGPARRRPILMPTAVVNETEEACGVISAILSPHGWVIERVDPPAAKVLVEAGFPPVDLLITCSLELLAHLTPEIPVILTLEEGIPEPTVQLQRLPLLAIVRKPLIYGVLRNVIQRFCDTRPKPSALLGVYLAGQSE
jgi:hypothetical protein